MEGKTFFLVSRVLFVGEVERTSNDDVHLNMKQTFMRSTDRKDSSLSGTCLR
jgi:hypothetical protein